jgi:hypothetical protein
MNGLHIVLLIIVVVAALASYQRSGDARPASAIVNFPLWLLVCTGFGSFFAGAGVLTFKIYRRLIDGRWPTVDNFTLLDWLGVTRPAAASRWVLDVLSWDAVITLMAVIAGSLWGLFSLGLIAMLLGISPRLRSPGLDRGP